MIRLKPEQDDTKRKAGVFRVYHLFKSVFISNFVKIYL